MFAHSFFPARYFAPRYWPPAAASTTTGPYPLGTGGGSAWPKIEGEQYKPRPRSRRAIARQGVLHALSGHGYARSLPKPPIAKPLVPPLPRVVVRPLAIEPKPAPVIHRGRGAASLAAIGGAGQATVSTMAWQLEPGALVMRGAGRGRYADFDDAEMAFAANLFAAFMEMS